MAALAFSVRWAYGILEAFQPDFNPNGGVPEGYRPRIAVLGFFGMLAALVAAGSAIAYAKTAAPRWVVGVAVGGLCAVGLFAVWIDLWDYAGGVG